MSWGHTCGTELLEEGSTSGKSTSPGTKPNTMIYTAVRPELGIKMKQGARCGQKQ